MARKKRIVITVVTEDARIETKIIEGAEMMGGRLSPGPSERQFEIVFQALRDLIAAEAKP